MVDRSISRLLKIAALGALGLPVAQAHAADEKINYQEHVLPILRNSCLNCHNPDKKKAGLDLTTYTAALAGSDNGPVINPGDPSGSKFYKVTTHSEEPEMPPKRDKLPDKELEILRKWIASGALETANGKPAVALRPKVDLTLTTVGLGKPTGPVAMPKGLAAEPLTRTARAGALPALGADPWAPVVAVGGQRQVMLYNTQTLELLGVLAFPEGLPQTLRFSRSGSLLMAAGGQGAQSGRVVLFDVASGNRVTEIGDEFDTVLAADISPDQSMVALGGPGRIVKAYTVSDGKLAFSIKKHTDWVTAIAFSPDGNLLATADRAGGIAVWEARTGHEMFNLAGHKEAVSDLAFRDDSNLLVSCSTDGTAKLWNMQEGTEVKSWAAHGNYRAPTGAVGAGTFDPAVGALSIGFAHDGRIVSCGRDHAVKIWGPDGAAVRTLEAPFNDIALHVTFDHEGGRVIAGDWTGQVKVWNAADGKVIGELSANPPTLAERLDAATHQLAELQPAADKATADLAAAKSAAEKADAEAKAAVAAADQAKKAIDTAAAKLNEQKTALDAANGATKPLQDAVAARQAEAARLEQSVLRAADAQKQLDAQAESARNAATSKLKSIDAKQHALDEAAASAKGNDDADLKKKVEELEADLHRLQSEQDELQKAATAKSEQARKTSDELAQARTESARAADALSAARQAVSAQNEKIAGLSRSLAAAQQAADKSRQDAAEAAKQVAPKDAVAKSAAETFAKMQAATDVFGRLADTRREIAVIHASQARVTLNAATKAVADREADHAAAVDAVKAAESAIEKTVADLAAVKKAAAERPQRMLTLSDAVKGARLAAAGAKTAADAAIAAVAERDALAKEAGAFAEKLKAAAAKAPTDKPLADAAAAARGSADQVAASLAAAKAGPQAEALKHAEAALAAAEAALKTEDEYSSPASVDRLTKVAAAAVADLPTKQAAAAATVKPVEEAKAKVAPLQADYDRLAHEADAMATKTASTK